MAAASISFYPLRHFSVQARSSKTRNPQKRTSSRKLSKKPNPKPKTLITSDDASNIYRFGSDATTYTRLPPRDDSFDLHTQTHSELKLSDLTSPAIFEQKNAVPEDDYLANSASDEEIVYTTSVFDEEVTKNSELFGDSELGLGFEDQERVTTDFLEEDEFGLGFDGDDDVEEKEKGIPAVMRCFDRAKVYVRAGDGGNGVVAFRREKFVPLGGPSGGDGGRGGNVYVEVDGSMNSLLPFRKSIHFRAGRGSHGQGKKQDGARGEDVVVKVAPGTVIRDSGTGNVLMELLNPGQRALLLPGGRGGKGNAAFKSGTNKVPKIAERGEEGAEIDLNPGQRALLLPHGRGGKGNAALKSGMNKVAKIAESGEGAEMWLDLELKLVADVGIVGAPNAGKSTLLSAITAAQPEIANYPFTTLLPNLGVVSLDYDATMVVADLPGLLEGAHRGFGLGHEFLRHTERCSVLVHVVDGSGQQPVFEYDAVRLELELFSPLLAEKPYIVVFNKMDLPEASESWESFDKNLQARGIRPFCISAVNRQGTHDVVCAAYELLPKIKDTKWDSEEGWTDPENLNHVADMIKKQRSASMSDFQISHDSSSNTWHVVGAGIQRFVQMTNWQYSESMRRFQHVLDASGVNKALIKQGVQEGDTVVVGEMEMVWHDSAGKSAPSNMRKGSSGSVKWPQWA